MPWMTYEFSHAPAFNFSGIFSPSLAFKMTVTKREVVEFLRVQKISPFQNIYKDKIVEYLIAKFELEENLEEHRKLFTSKAEKLMYKLRKFINPGHNKTKVPLERVLTLPNHKVAHSFISIFSIICF